jgi:low temperature requirement protein LtrA
VTSSIWQKPVRRSTADGHRQATWIELFFDLIFVVAVAQLATLLLEDVSWWSGTLYAVAYMAVWLSWVNATFYANRFDSDDLSQRLITFAQMLTVAGMAASVAESAAIPFAVSIALFRLLTAVSYARVREAIPADGPHANRMVIEMTAIAAIWAASVFEDGRARVGVWVFAIGLEIGIQWLRSSRKRRGSAAIQMNHLVERFGLFTIIVLGETVLAVVVGVAHAHWEATAVVFAALGMTIPFSLWWIYFEGVVGTPLKNIGGIRPLVWVYGQALLVMSITALGIGLEVAIFAELGESLGTPHTIVLAGSLGLALIGIAVVLASEATAESRTQVVLARIPAVLLVVVMGVLPVSAQILLIGLAIIAAAQAVVDVRSSRQGALEHLAGDREDRGDVRQ